MTAPLTQSRPSIENRGLPADAAQKTRWRIEKRLHVSRAWQLAAAGIALAASLGLSSILIAVAGASIPEAIAAALSGAFGSSRRIAETLAEATPLILTGLAVTVAFRASIWNIGVEGQFLAGAIGGVAVALAWGETLPAIVLLPIILFSAAASGALLAAIPGFLKVRYGVSEVIVTIMLNFIMSSFLSYILSGPWRDPTTLYYQTIILPEASHLPRIIPRTRLHLGFAMALMAALAVYLLLWKNKLGYEIRAIGINPIAAAYKGIDVTKVTILVMVISGVIAGLAGAGQTPGLQQRLQLDISRGFGFTGIIIAMLGRRHPLGVILAALFFGALVTGASAMQVAVNVPVSITEAIQGITLVMLLVADLLAQYRLRRVVGHA